MTGVWQEQEEVVSIIRKLVGGSCSAVGGSGISSKQDQLDCLQPAVTDQTFAQATHLQPVTSCDRLPPPGCS